MTENQLNNLPPEEAAPPPPVEATAPEVSAEPVIDKTPDPSILKAQIEELEQKRKKAEEDAVYWRKQKAEARADYFKGGDRVPERQPPPPPVSYPESGPEPKPSDFEDYDKFVVALTDHRVKTARMQWEMDTARKEQQKTQMERQQNLQAKLQEGFTKFPDFEEVAFDRSAIHITPMVVDILADCEHPADLAYYLAKNRVEGVAISRMTPIQAARAIAKLEAKLEGQPPQSLPNPSPTKPITNAPPPISPVGAGKAGIQKDPEKMTQKEYAAYRLSHGAKRY